MRLLLIHTGGTIGMAPGPSGLAPMDGLVEAALSGRLPPGIALSTHVFAPLLDSSDVGPAHWNEMLAVIRAHPDVPVIVTHGTDTMAFSGAALSQELAGEARRVILCGSMIPLGGDGDAEGNLALAIDAALGSAEEGVWLAFAGRLMPAAGLVKRDSHAADAFRSLPQVKCQSPLRRFFAPRRLAVLTLTPGLPAAFLRSALSTLDGAVLRVFGSGTMMDDRELLDVLTGAVRAGQRIRAVSQCETGGLEPGVYQASAGLWSTGIENGGNETPEAALIHLWLN